ncbi:MAG: DUF402 domain-containing protein [Chloroflexota bacterium]
MQLKNSGEHVVHRGVYKGKVWIARPATVVVDQVDEIRLLIRPGSICKFTTGLRSRKYRTDDAEPVLSRWDEQRGLNWSFYDHVWLQKRILLINRPEDYYSVQLHWDDQTDEFIYWYINFELPLTRSGYSFDTLDLEIDLIVHPDYSMEWKDLAEFEEGVAVGMITPEQVKRIENGKEEILRYIQSEAYLFSDQNLINWKPPIAWEIPQLHADWQKV